MTSIITMNYEELIQYCKYNNIEYLTKKNKPKAHKTLLKELSDNVEINNLEQIIKQCHNYLYKSAGIVGSKAQNDIMRVLIIRIFNILLSNKNIYINKLIEDYKNTNSILKDFKDSYNENINTITNDKIKIKIQKYLNYIEYLYDINKILEYKGNAIEDEWKEFIVNCVSNILKNIYSKDDYRFNTPNSYDINELIKIVSKINISDNFINNFAEHNGDIHEYFLKYQGNVNSKELGQFFTPRIIIDKLLNECGLKDLILNLDNSNLTICDPCMGTGGLLCYTYKYCKYKIKPSNIYGCDIEKDTIKFGVASLMLTTNEYNDNIIRCNSLIENSYLFENKKFNIIFTNPPFGTKNDYKDLKKNFDSYKNINYENSTLNFEDVYPINTNKGTILFVQLVIYLLKKKGICAIVLPDGEFMTSNNNSNIEIRKFILNKCKIIKIINVESGAFINTGIKTKVLIFQKGDYDNYNQEVEFVEINSNGINLLGKEKLNETYQFNLSKKEDKISYNKDIEIKTLGEVCEFCIKSKRLASYGKSDGIYPFITSSQEITKYCDEPDYKDDNYIIIGNGGNANIHYQNNFSCSSHCYVLKGTKYIYYYLINNINMLEDGFKGATIHNISKEYIKNIKIPIPSLEKQKEIVEYLDFNNNLIDNLNKEIENNKNQAKLFLNMFISN